MANAKTASEGLFEEYLTAQGYSWEYEQQVEGKPTAPDYRIHHNEFVGFFEVKEFDAPALGERFMGVPADPYRPLREKLNMAARQFKHYKEYPCSVVMSNPNGAFVNFKKEIVLGSMLGRVAYQVPFGPAAKDGHKPELTFLGDGKMFDVKRKAGQNKTINAIIILDRYRLNEKLNDVTLFEYEAFLGRPASMAECLDVLPEPTAEPLRVVVYENPLARIPLSRALFCGPYDERWGVEEDLMRKVFLGEEIVRLEDRLGAATRPQI